MSQITCKLHQYNIDQSYFIDPTFISIQINVDKISLEFLLKKKLRIKNREECSCSW